MHSKAPKLDINVAKTECQPNAHNAMSHDILRLLSSDITILEILQKYPDITFQQIKGVWLTAHGLNE